MEPLHPPGTPTPPPDLDMSTQQLDEIDLKLVDLLQRDGRATIRTLAEQVGLSASGCMRRVQALEDAGVILGYQARVDAERLGLSLQAFVHVGLEKHDKRRLTAFIEEVNGWPEVMACYSTTGETDYLLHVVVRDLADLKHFMMDRLTDNPAIGRLSTSIVLEVSKPAAGYALDRPPPRGKSPGRR